MKKTSKFLAIVLSVVLCICLLTIPAMAQTAEQDGIKVTLTTDKTEYAETDPIVATAMVENNSGKTLYAVSLKHTGPDGYGVAAGAARKDLGNLAAGASDTLEVTFSADAPAGTGDTVGIVIAVLLVAGLGVLALTCRKGAVVALALVMLLGAFGMPLAASAASNAVEVTTTVKVGGADVTLKASVSYDPDPVIYSGLRISTLDGLAKEDFGTAMNETWNFGWHGGTPDTTAAKVDFEGTAPTSAQWHIGTEGAEGTAQVMNAGWGVGLWTQGEGSRAFMYCKTDIPENSAHFRIWAVSNTSEHWSGSGAIRAVALYKNAAGEYVKHVLVPTNDNAFMTQEMDTVFTEDGYVVFKNASNFNLPGACDPANGMLIYNLDALKGINDVVIVVETAGLGTVLGTEATEAAEGVANGAVMPEMIIIKRIMVIA